ncbi:MAG TPA: sucrase ferredoxin [Nocardioides sp.]|uniref:sucrase ferredoxin n=1 Tax=Nocardioides sp. TaxID=35761 RepID=UPI002EDB79A3
MTSFRCAAASLARAEPIAGTATHVRTWLLLEHVGPWGNTALLDARLPDGLGAALRDRAQELRAKILLIRRVSSRPSTPYGVRVFAAYADPLRPRLESGVVGDPRDVLDLDLGALRRGGSTGLPAYDGPLFCVCTNGRHDACCAERGRPVAAALDAAHPEHTWEVSHIGGDRFAANLVVLPHGLYYGRLDPAAALTVADSHRDGLLTLDLLRGRASYPMPVQAAEIALRRELGLLGLAAVELVDRSVADEVTTVDLAAGGAIYRVRVRTTRDSGDTAQLTCKASRPNPVPSHEVLGIEPLPPAAEQ